MSTFGWEASHCAIAACQGLVVVFESPTGFLLDVKLDPSVMSRCSKLDNASSLAEGFT